MPLRPFCCSLALGLLLIAPRAAHAQSTPPFQVAAEFATLRIGDPGSLNAGVGGRFSFDLRSWMSLEAELNLFPHDNLEIDSRSLADLRLTHERRRVDAFFGPKIGWSGGRFGVFGAARPGFSRLSDRGVRCDGPDCVVAIFARPVYRTEFAANLAGVFEAYPTRRTVARVDIGDTIIRHRSFAPPCQDCTTHNLSTRFGFGVRF